MHCALHLVFRSLVQPLVRKFADAFILLGFLYHFMRQLRFFFGKLAISWQFCSKKRMKPTRTRKRKQFELNQKQIKNTLAQIKIFRKVTHAKSSFFRSKYLFFFICTIRMKKNFKAFKSSWKRCHACYSSERVYFVAVDILQWRRRKMTMRMIRNDGNNGGVMFMWNVCFMERTYNQSSSISLLWNIHICQMVVNF